MSRVIWTRDAGRGLPEEQLAGVVVEADLDPGSFHTLEVPPAYLDDHMRAYTMRDQVIVEDGSRGRKRITVSDRDLDELRSRAAYTIEAQYQPENEWLGLKSSARATVRAIDRYLKS
jgi:hypothetical protein